MKWAPILIILLAATIVMAYQGSTGGWFIINSTTQNFTTNDVITQNCDMGSGTVNASCVFTWIINSTGFGLYELKSLIQSTSPNVTFSNSSAFNVSIWDKGNNSNVIPNYSCSYCSFQIVNGTNTTIKNPTILGYLENNSTIAAWTINATGPLNSTWDVFGIFDYNSSTGIQKTTSVKKVRIVEYPWWNTSFNCRKMFTVNVLNISNAVQFLNFNYTDSQYCKTISCINETRVLEILSDKSQALITNMEVSQASVVNLSDTFVCSDADIRFDYSQSGNHSFFVYYSSPGNEHLLNVSLNTNTSSFSLNNVSESVWDWYYDSHINLYWEPEPSKSHTDRINSTFIANTLRTLGYSPQIITNNFEGRVIDRLPYDKIFAYLGHGAVKNDGLNYSLFGGRFPVSQSDMTVTSYGISSLSQDLETKFVFMKVSFGGDNSTTLTNCTLNNWLSKAFTEKGAGCYLGFLGLNQQSTCAANCNCSSDVLSDLTGNFTTCFWNKISLGESIEIANDLCQNSGVNSIIVNSSPNSCAVSL